MSTPHDTDLDEPVINARLRRAFRFGVAAALICLVVTFYAGWWLRSALIAPDDARLWQALSACALGLSAGSLSTWVGVRAGCWWYRRSR